MMTYGTIIVIKRSGVDGSSFPLMSNTCLIGRDSICDIRIQLPTVSQQHSRIDVLEDGQILLTNLSGTNPTTLNNHAIKKCVHVHHMDIFTIADRSFRWEFPPNSQYYSPKRSSSPKKYGSPTSSIVGTNEYTELSSGSKSPPGGEHRSFKVLLGSPPRHSPPKRSLQKPLSSGKKVPYLLSPRPGKYTPKKKLTSLAHAQLSPMRDLDNENGSLHDRHFVPTAGKTPPKRQSFNGTLLKTNSPKIRTPTSPAARVKKLSKSPKISPMHYSKTPPAKAVKTPSPKIISGKASPKILPGKTSIPKRLSGKTPSPKVLSGKTPSTKRLSGKATPKSLSGKSPRPKSLSGKAISPKNISGKSPSPKILSAKTLSPQRLSGKTTPKSLSGKSPRHKILSGKSTPKSLSGKSPRPKRLSGKAISPKNISGKSPSPKILSAKTVSLQRLSGKTTPKSLPGKSPGSKRRSGKSTPKRLSGKSTPKRLSGKSTPKSLSGKSPRPKRLSGKAISPKNTSGKTPSPKILSAKIPSPKRLSGKTSPKNLSGKSPRPKRLSKKIHSPKIVSGKSLSPKSPSGKTPSAKGQFGKASSPKSPSGKNSSPKSPSGKTSPKSPTRKIPSPKRPTGKILSPRSPTGKILSPKSPTGKFLSPKSPTGKILSPRSPTGKFLSPKSPTGKILSPKSPTGKFLSPKSPTGKILSPKSPTGKFLSPKSPTGKILSPKSPTGKTSPKSPSGRTPSPKNSSEKTPSPTKLSGKKPYTVSKALAIPWIKSSPRSTFSSVNSGKTPSPKAKLSQSPKVKRTPSPKVKLTPRMAAAICQSLTPSPKKLRGRASGSALDSGRRKTAIALLLSKHRKSGPTPRKNVSFGPKLTPEHFDKEMPASTPLRKGRRPRGRSTSSTTDSPVLTPAIVAGRASSKRSLSPSAQKTVPEAKKVNVKELMQSSPRSNSASPKTPSKKASPNPRQLPIVAVKKRKSLQSPSSKRASSGERGTPATKHRKSMNSDEENVVKIDSPASPDSKKSAALRTIHASKFRLASNGLPKTPATTKSGRSSLDRKSRSSGGRNSSKGNNLKSLRRSASSNNSGIADMLKTPTSPRSHRFPPDKSKRLSMFSGDTSFDMQSFQTPNVPNEMFVSPMTVPRKMSPSYSLKRMINVAASPRPAPKKSVRVKSRFPVKSPKSDYTDVAGVKRLMKSLRKSPRSDYTDVVGVKRLMKSPRKSPKSDYTDVVGVKRLMKSPRKSPRSDYTDVTGVKRLLKSPRKSPKSDYSDVTGVKRLMKSPRKSPRSDYTDVAGVKRLLKSPKKSPRSDYTDVTGVKRLMKSPRNSPQSTYVDIKGVNCSTDVSDGANLSLSGKKRGPYSAKKVLRTQYQASLSPKKSPLKGSAKIVSPTNTPTNLEKREVGKLRKVSPMSPTKFYPLRHGNRTEDDIFKGKRSRTSKPSLSPVILDSSTAIKELTPSLAKRRSELKTPISVYLPRPASSKMRLSKSPVIPKSTGRGSSSPAPSKTLSRKKATPSPKSPEKSPRQRRLRSTKPPKKYSPSASATIKAKTPTKQYPKRGRKATTVAPSSAKIARRTKKNEAAEPEAIEEVTVTTPVQVKSKGKEKSTSKKIVQKGRKAEKVTPKVQETTPVDKPKGGRATKILNKSPVVSKEKSAKSKKSTTKVVTPSAASPRRTRQTAKKVSPKKSSPVSRKKKASTKAGSPAKTSVARTTRRSKRT